MSNYVTSIIYKYGDTDKVPKDVTTLKEIYSRQGTTLFIDVIADIIGTNALQFNLDTAERLRLMDSICNELREAISERI